MDSGNWVQNKNQKYCSTSKGNKYSNMHLHHVEDCKMFQQKKDTYQFQVV